MYFTRSCRKGHRLEKPTHRIRNESLLRSQATIAAGLAFGTVTLLLLMCLAQRVDQIQCSQAALIALFFDLGVAPSTFFIGIYASARGLFAIPYLGNKPISSQRTSRATNCCDLRLSDQLYSPRNKDDIPVIALADLPHFSGQTFPSVPAVYATCCGRRAC